MTTHSNVGPVLVVKNPERRRRACVAPTRIGLGDTRTQRREGPAQLRWLQSSLSD